MADKPNYIRVAGVYRLPKGIELSEYEAHVRPRFQDFLQQVREDALTGTFGEFDKSIFADTKAFEKFKETSNELAKVRDLVTDAIPPTGRLPFELLLESSVFADVRIGFQKLVHVLASDLFERRVTGLDGFAEITDVDLGSLADVFAKNYRPKSHAVASIRSQLELSQDEPLLAFTIKPRTGLSHDDYIHLATSAFEGGCQVVEMDTRDLDIAEGGRTDSY